MIRKILFVLVTMTLSFSILLLGRTQIPDKVLAQAEKLIPKAAFSPSSYTLKHVGSQGVVTDMTMCKVYGSFIKKTGSTGSLNYRLYIDNVAVGTFATKNGGSYNINLNSTCVPRFGDNKCINIQSRFTHNIQHTIKLQVQLDDGNWYYAQAHSPFPKTLTCQDQVVTSPTPVPTKTKTSTPIPPTPTAVPPTKTATPVITTTATKTPTPAISQTPVPYQIQNSVVYTTNFAYPELGCKWIGIAGQVFDKSGNPISNLVVGVEGTLGGKVLDGLSLTGLSPLYGPGGYEVSLATSTIASSNTLKITVYNLAGQPVSDSIAFPTYTDCTKNLIIANFMQK